MVRFVEIFLMLLILAAPIYAGSIVDDSNIILQNNIGIINGSVYSDRGEPISEAKLLIYSDDFSILDSITADSEGRFIYQLASGKYYISAEASNYVKRFFPNEYLITLASTINVFPSQIIDISLELEQGCLIYGQIYTGGGGYESNFLVSAIKVDYPYEGWQYDKYFSIIQQGEYCLDGLLPGYYKVLVRAPGYKTVFYPQAEIFKEGEIIHVTSDSAVYGIDFELEMPGYGFIYGMISETNTGVPIQGATVYAYQWANIWGDPYRVNAVSDERGFYSFVLTAGYYYFETVIENDAQPDNNTHLFYDNRFDPKLADLVYVESNQDSPAISFQFDQSLYYNLNISGTILNHDNDYPMEGIRLTALDYDSGRPIAYDVSDHWGSFKINNLITGSYIIEISGDGIIPNFWPNVFKWQEAEVVTLHSTGSIIHDGGAITQDYGTPGFSISGIVNGDSGPLTDVRIYAINIDNNFISYDITDFEGKYLITSGLHEGPYTVFADLHGYYSVNYPSTLYLDLIDTPNLFDIDFYLEPVITGIKTEIPIPKQCRLLGNYPNPFNSSTVIKFSADRRFKTDIDIYNIGGQLVCSIPISVSTGTNLIQWNGKSSAGNSVSSGIYFYRIQEFPETKKMLLLR